VDFNTKVALLQKAAMFSKVALSPALIAKMMASGIRYGGEAIKGVAGVAKKAPKTLEETMAQVARIAGKAKTGKGATAKSVRSLEGMEQFAEKTAPKFKSTMNAGQEVNRMVDGDTPGMFGRLMGKKPTTKVDLLGNDARDVAADIFKKEVKAPTPMHWAAKGTLGAGGAYGAHKGIGAAWDSAQNPGTLHNTNHMWDPNYNKGMQPQQVSL